MLVGAEPSLPYDRPPLSKQVLAGEWGPDEIVLRPADDYSSLALDMRLGRRATALDLDARAVVLDDGERVAFDGLVIATGCRPRLLPGTPDIAGIHVLRTLDDAVATGASPRTLPELDGRPGVHTLRTLDDSIRLRAALEQARHVTVIGAGFIGSEVAATCRMSGLDVTLLEALPVPLARALGDEMGAACAELHRDNGVDLRVGVAPAGFDGDEQVERVRLSDGSAIDADVVVVGVGVAPETAWLEGSGLALGDGVLCDASCFASAPGVVAAGDVARWHNPLFGVDMRVEHWTNAAEQGMAAARALLAGAGAEPFAPVPYFWSDQYDAKIQFVGTCAPDDEVRIVHGSVAERRFVAIYGRAGRLVGALALSRPRLLVAYRRLIAERASWEDALAHEPT